MKTPGNWTIEGLFADRPEALALFEVVRQYAESLGEVMVEPIKTQVAFAERRKFLWVWLPQVWTRKRPDSSITLTFVLDRRIEDRRIAEAVMPRPGYWTHHVVLESASALDDVVRNWLREAYVFAQSRRSSLPV